MSTSINEYSGNDMTKDIVYYGCSEKDDLLLYKVPCKFCGKEFSLAISKNYMTGSVGDYLPHCPHCTTSSAFMIVSDFLGSKFANNKIELRDVNMGGMSITSLYALYPEIEGEPACDRDNRILAYVHEECKEEMKTEPEQKEKLIRDLYAINPYITHETARILRCIATAPNPARKEELINKIYSIQPMENAASILPHFGIGAGFASGMSGNPTIIR